MLEFSINVFTAESYCHILSRDCLVASLQSWKSSIVPQFVSDFVGWFILCWETILGIHGVTSCCCYLNKILFLGVFCNFFTALFLEVHAIYWCEHDLGFQWTYIALSCSPDGRWATGSDGSLKVLLALKSRLSRNLGDCLQPTTKSLEMEESVLFLPTCATVGRNHGHVEYVRDNFM